MPDAMNYSQRETFFWLKDAALLDKTYIILHTVSQLERGGREAFWARKTPNPMLAKLKELPDKEFAREIGHAIASHPTEILDFCKVRRSLGMATTRLIHLLREEVSVDDLDKKRNEKGEILSGGLRLDETRYGLRIAKVTGNVRDRIVHFAIEQANKRGDTQFFINLGLALSMKKRPKEINYDRIGMMPRFLVGHWCGDRGTYGMWINVLNTTNTGGWRCDHEGFALEQAPSFFFLPPLCFLSNKALTSVCAWALQENVSDDALSTAAVRKWVSRLGLKRPSKPRIKEAREITDGIYFVT
jgi:hypothetical protein